MQSIVKNIKRVFSTTSNNSSSGGSFLPITTNITYNDLSILRSNNGLVVSAFYKITDRADAGLIVQATSPNTLSLSGQGLFLNPDFQKQGNYSGLTNAVGVIQGVWNAADETTYSNNDVVFWDGLMYQIIDDSMFDTNPPNINTVAYEVIPKSENNGYILESDSVEYSFDLDLILSRSDKRNNVFNFTYDYTTQPFTQNNFFQWGNNNVTGNKIKNCTTYNIINQRGTFLNNINDSCFSFEIDNAFTGQFKENSITCGGIPIYITGNSTIEYCTINTEGLNPNIVGGNFFDFTNVNFAYKTIAGNYSNFDITIDMNSGYDAGNNSIIAIIPVYVGIVFLSGLSNSLITSISNFTSLLDVAYYAVPGEQQRFQAVNVAASNPGDIIADTTAVVTIVGRTFERSDFITFRNHEQFNKRINVVKLA